MRRRRVQWPAGVTGTAIATGATGDAPNLRKFLGAVRISMTYNSTPDMPAVVNKGWRESCSMHDKDGTVGQCNDLLRNAAKQ